MSVQLPDQTTRIAVIIGHPDPQSYCAALAHAYVESARAAGATVREINLSELSFDPVLWHGYRKIQPLEPDLVAAQDTIRWADLKAPKDVAPVITDRDFVIALIKSSSAAVSAAADGSDAEGTAEG
jgi:hypothetical protein